MSDNISKKEAIAKRLAIARKHAGLSQGQVAILVKLHRPTISEIEAGRRNVIAEELSKFAEIYKVDIEWLMSDIGDDTQSIVQKSKIELAARELSKLKDEDLNKIMELLAAMKSS